MKTLVSLYCRFLGQDESKRAAVISYTVASLLLILISIYPLKNYYQASREEYLQQFELATWLQSHHSELQSFTTKKEPQVKLDSLLGSKGSKTLVALLSETAGKKNVLISRIEQHSLEIKIIIEKGAFSNIFNWLRVLSDVHGTNIDQIRVHYIENNQVAAIITFSSM